MRKKGRPSLADARELDRNVLAAALQVLIEKGENATMQAVAEAAGVSRKTLYARFPNKSVLFCEAAATAAEGMKSVEITTAGNLEQRILGYLEQVLDLIHQPFSRHIVGMLKADLGEDPDLAERLKEGAINLFFLPLKSILDDGVRSGEADIEDIDMTAWAIISLLDVGIVAGILNSSAKPGGGIAAYARFLTRFAVHGLVKRAPAGRAAFESND